MRDYLLIQLMPSSSVIPCRGGFKGIRSNARWAAFVLFKALTIASNARAFHKTKDPQQMLRV